jgi:molybdenum cofactor cytidylyltransferase
MTTGKNIGAIILAAGASSRLGTPKQLLPYGGTTLLEYTVQVASDSIASPIIVVLGSEAQNMRTSINGDKVQTILNDAWQEGIASSIQAGIEELVLADPSTEGAVILVCDQPYITAELIDDLVAKHQETGKRIIASSYDETLGVPALFHKSLFPVLLQLRGDSGAKSIIQQHTEDLGIVAFAKGGVDIDTEEDYKDLSRTNTKS